MSGCWKNFAGGEPLERSVHYAETIRIERSGAGHFLSVE